MPDIMPWHVTELLNPKYTRVDLVKEGANSQAHIKLFKQKGGIEMDFEKVLKSLNPDHAKIIQDEIAKQLSEKETEHNQALTVLEKAKKDAEEALAEAQSANAAAEQSEEEIVKSIKDPALRKLMETQIAKAKAAEAEVRKAREEALTAEAINKSAELTGIGADTETLAKVYKTLTLTDTQLRDDVFGILKAAQNVISEGAGVATEIGKSAPGAGNKSSEEEAWAKIESAATEIAKSRGISQTAAIAKAMEENPGLYREYINAQMGV